MHVSIGDLIENSLGERAQLVRDQACGGNQQIPLFCSNEKSNKTEYCNVDLLVIQDGKIRVIIEIEESDVKPTQICGKFLTSALARYYIHETEGARSPCDRCQCKDLVCGSVGNPASLFLR